MTIRQINFVAGEAISRKQMLEMGMPIGNPHKPPFKQKEMPFIVSAVTAASVAISAAAAAGTAAAIGTAVLATVGAIGTIAAVAGTAMSVVGMVTGDKGLMKIGAIVGLAGGVASLASGAIASLAAGGEFAMGTAGIQSANAANAAAANAANVGNIAAHGIATGVTGSVVTGQAAKDAATLTANMSPVTNTGGAINSFVGSAQAGTGVASPLIGNTGGSLLSSSQALGIGNAGNLATTGNLATSGSSGFFGKLVADMTPKDYLLMGGAVVSGAMNEMDKNTANVNAQKKYEYEKAVRQRKITNLNATPLS